MEEFYRSATSFPDWIVAGLFNPRKEKGCQLFMRYRTCFTKNIPYLNLLKPTGYVMLQQFNIKQH